MTDLEVLLDSLARKKRERSNYVGEEYVAPEEKKAVKQIVDQDMAANLNPKEESKVSVVNGRPVLESAPLVASGVVTDEPAAPAAPVAPKPSVRDILPPPSKQMEEPAAADIPQQTEQPKPQPAGPQKDGSFPWDRLLMGATPLLVGLLTGNQLEGVQTSAKQFVDTEADLFKRERDLAGKLEEIKAKREIEGVSGGKRRFQAATIAVEDPTAPGQIANVKATFDTFTGKYLLPDGSEIPSAHIRAGYAVNPEEFDRRSDVKVEKGKELADYKGTGAYNSPTTGERVILRNGVEIPVAGQNTGKLTVKQQNEVKELRTAFNQNPVVKRTLPVLSVSQSLQNLLNSGRPVSQKAAQTLLARMSGEVGNLNMMEQQLYMGSPSINESAKRWLNLQATDRPLQPHEVEELIQIASHYTASSRELLERAVKETQATATQDYNLPEDSARRITSPVAAPLLEQADKAEKMSAIPSIVFKGKRHPAPDRQQTLAVEIDGQLFWTDAAWEDVKEEHPKAKRLN